MDIGWIGHGYVLDANGAEWGYGLCRPCPCHTNRYKSEHLVWIVQLDYNGLERYW